MKQTQKTYRVKAIWKTLQGEGLFAGRPAVFVRMVGCNMWSGYANTRERDAERNQASCPLWCDTDFTKEGSETYSNDELAHQILSIAGEVRFCVVTGGEPLMQLDAELMKVLHKHNFFVAIETNGSLSLRETCLDDETGEIEAPDWIVCSPKLNEQKLSLEYFDELKLVVPGYMPAAYTEFAKRQRENNVQGHPLPLLWLQPEDGSQLEKAKQLSIELALDNPAWRVSVQIHKILDVD